MAAGSSEDVNIGDVDAIRVCRMCRDGIACARNGRNAELRQVDGSDRFHHEAICTSVIIDTLVKTEIIGGLVHSYGPLSEYSLSINCTKDL